MTHLLNNKKKQNETEILVYEQEKTWKDIWKNLQFVELIRTIQINNIIARDTKPVHIYTMRSVELHHFFVGNTSVRQAVWRVIKFNNVRRASWRWHRRAPR